MFTYSSLITYHLSLIAYRSSGNLLLQVSLNRTARNEKGFFIDLNVQVLAGDFIRSANSAPKYTYVKIPGIGITFKTAALAGYSGFSFLQNFFRRTGKWYGEFTRHILILDLSTGSCG